MKITLFLSFLTVFQLLAIETYSQLTKLSLNLKDMKIADALKEIENQSEFYFLYSPKFIDVEKTVSISAEKESVTNILNDIFGDKVNYFVQDKQIVISPKDELDVSVKFQQQRISGRVTDISGNPLAGVTVAAKGTNVGDYSGQCVQRFRRIVYNPKRD